MKVKKLKRIVLSTTAANLYSFMKCFGSCQFLRGSWMDLSDEVANIHMRADAKNLVTNTISMLRKEACSRSLCDLAHIPAQNCLADCLTTSSAKADYLITAVKTGISLDVDIHADFRTRMEHKAFISTRCRTFMHIWEKEVFILNTLKISLAPLSQEGSIQVMCMGTRHTQEQQERKTCEREGQNAIHRLMRSIPLASDVDLDENIVSVSGSHEPFCLVLRPRLQTL